MGTQGPFEVVLDTGSSDLILNGPACSSCRPSSFDPANASSSFVRNSSASPAVAPYGGFALLTDVGVAQVSLSGLPNVEGSLLIGQSMFNDLNRSLPPPRNNPYALMDGLMGFGGKVASFCSFAGLGNHCPVRASYIDSLLTSTEWVGSPTFSTLLPPYDNAGGAPTQPGTLTIGARTSSAAAAVAVPPPVTKPCADTLPAMQPFLEQGIAAMLPGHWWLVAEDILVNGVSTGVCHNQSAVGGCLVYTDTGTRERLQPTSNPQA